MLFYMSAVLLKTAKMLILLSVNTQYRYCVITFTKSCIVIISTFGHGIAFSGLKSLSFVTISSAFDAMAQSTNLLSSASPGSRLKCTYVFCIVVVVKAAIASTTLCATSAEEYSHSFSSYSSRISVLTHRLISPANTSVRIL